MIFGFNAQMFWFALFVIFLVAELATAVSLISVWFCIGALAAVITAGLGFNLYVQSLVFLVVSFVMLFATKPFVKNFLNVKHHATNADKIIGAKCAVTERIDNRQSVGAVKFEGKVWSAKSIEDSLCFDIGDEVLVDRIQGVTVYVKKITEE